MALEAVVYSHGGHFGGYGLMGGPAAAAAPAPWCCDDGFAAGGSGELCGGSWDDPLFAPSLDVQDVEEWEVDQDASSCKAA
ncbi:hypothetical protein E2562_003237, partial [Oryza meyeriana var. granulata]